jgi:hypothetical protein
VIVLVGRSAHAARSLRGFESLAKRERWAAADWYSAPVVDSTLEGFEYYPELDTISPLTIKKRWTKRELIDRVNSRENKSEGEVSYAKTSLSNKTCHRVVRDLVDLLCR